MRQNRSIPPPTAGAQGEPGTWPGLIDCTRAVFHARGENELARTLCECLVESGEYAEASIIFIEEPGAVSIRRPFYAGPLTECVEQPDRFWAMPSHQAELNGVLAKGVREPAAEGSGRVMLPLTSEGRVVAVLAIRTSEDRAFDSGELEQLEALANDGSVAVMRLQKNAERRAISAREKRLRETFEYAGVGINRIDEHGRFLEVNQKFCEMLGYSREELVGRTTRDVTVPEDYGPGAAFREQARLGKSTGSHTGEKRYVRKDGTHVWVRRTISPAFDETGSVRDTISVVEDITERKRAEELIRRERVRLRTVMDAMPDYIHVKDAQGNLQLANKAWLEARHVKADEVEGKTVFDLFPPALAQRMADEDRRVVETGEPLIDQETRILLAGDDARKSPRWSLTSKVPMRDDDDNIIGIVGVSRDITSKRRMERERTMEHMVVRVLSESRSVEETIPILIRTICKAMDWAYGARWIFDPAIGNVRRAEWWCEFEPQFDPSDEHYWFTLAGPVRGGLLRQVWMELRPAWLSDIEQVASFRRKPSCLKFGFRSAYAFPILANEERIGIMEFFGRDVREPDEALLEVSGVISNQIGQFIRRKQAEESLQESEQQLRAMFENADVGITVSDLDMRYLRVNDKFCKIVGYAAEDLLRMRVSEVNLEENVERMQARRARLMREELPSSTTEKQLVRKDGSLVWVSLATSLVRASDGSPRYFITVTQDISESKRAAAALKELAHYDILTKLPNRALFYDRLAHGLAQARRNDWVLGVLFIDVDRFKHVNDTFGHTAGDQLLKLISERLAECVRGDDTVGRLSGDEFAIVLGRLGAPEDAALVAKKIVQVLNRPFQLQGAELYVTASIGITLYPADATNQDTLIRNADVAMYRAKDLGRNNYQFFTPEMNKRTREMLSMEGELRRALERDEFVLHYQPIVSLATGRITSLEALLRWQHPERGLVSPGDFMPLLEETGLVVRAGDWVLRAACRQLKAWERAGIRLVPVAINLSARQFLAPDLAQSIRQILEEHQVSAQRLEVELTESSIMSNPEDAVRTLEYLDAMGLRIAIDDFGTGYSSLSYLKRFPIRALKVDRSFVRDITSDPDDAAITQAVISMAHSLDLQVIAEGVETEAQLAFLVQYGCDEVQGFLFSRAVPGEECSALIADDRHMARLVETIKEKSAYRLT